jgi:eukaryotic-like serine/threonine-protein kinase
VLQIGETLANRFSVESLARRGGMGAIYRGTDLETAQPVAIKITGFFGAGARARFSREIRLLADLSHPGIVRHLGHGTTADGKLYLVMEWLEGEDLAQRLAHKPLGVDESLGLVRRACEALAVAHARGIVHRDIKPANLFLKDGDPESVTLLDFGIARPGERAQTLTHSGALIGTMGYMAPEQAMGEEGVDSRADVFAIGCVLYECLTGKAPFASAHAVGVLAKVLREDPLRPSELRPEIGRRIDGLVSRLLAKNREQRPRDATAVLALLAGLAGETPDTGQSARSLSFVTRAEQRIVSQILGRPQSPGERPDATSVRELSSRFGAEVAPLQGGSILFVLTGKGEANDRASQAALCALDLRELRPDLTLTVATGLAETSGQVPVGSAIDRAAALLGADTASGPGVFLDDVTLGLIGFRFEVQRVDGKNVLLGARRDVGAPRLLMGRPTPHVGRDRELKMLDGVLEECLADRVARTVVVTGPPGIGKSRLTGEWLGAAGRSGGARVLFARADPRSAGSALFLVAQLLRDAIGLREADAAETQLHRLREYLRRAEGAEQIVEFTAEILGLGGDREPSELLRAARGNPEIMSEQIRRALHGWLDAETSGQGVIIVIEDLHWGDTPSVSFLAEAIRLKAECPLMVLALARPEVERQFPELSEIANLRIRLQGLVARAAEQLVKAALEASPASDVVLRLIRTADGNPFYLEELIRRVAAGGTDWPDSVLAMAQSRIEQLDSQARFVLRAASVFGERSWDRGVQAMLVGSDLDARPLLDALAQGEFLVRVPESRYAGTAEYRFRHALLRDAAYAMLTEDDRPALHGVLAAWLEANNEKDARLLATHYELAGQAERAVPWLVRAAKAAVDAGDMVETIELATRGVRLGAQGPERGRLLLARGYAESLRGEPDLEGIREALDLLAFGSAPWWLGVSVLIFGACMRGQPEKAGPYVTLASEAPFASDQDLPFGQGMVTLVGGLVLLGKGDVAGRILDRAELAASTQPRRDPVFEAFLASARCALVAVAPLDGRWRLEEAFHGGKRAATALGALGAAHGESVALYYFSVAAMHLGRYEDARDATLRSAELTRRAASGIAEEWPLLFLAKAYVRLGKLDEALATLQPLSTSPDFTSRQMRPVLVAEALLRKGDYATAAKEVGEACTGVSLRLRRLAACVLASAELRQGEPERALATVGKALELPTSNGLESDIELYTLRAEALRACKRVQESVEAIAQARELVLGIAADIEDFELKRSFLENVEPCARALRLYERWSVESID